MPLPLSFDIFCRVVDNYGDIGVCWRLARRLAQHRDVGHIRLWVDDLVAFSRIEPSATPTVAVQILNGVAIHRWDTEEPTARPAQVVVEAFACDLPPAYIERMSDRELWINLEYLSAESWVESFHGVASLQPDGRRKFFFFPGFTPRTGGLIREPDLISQRDAWQADSKSRLAFLDGLGIGTTWLERLQAGASLVYVYCYPQAPLPALLKALSILDRDALVLLPEGIWPGALPSTNVVAGNIVEILTHPFVDQNGFDRLLWSSDLNVVRGEDSLVRAIWAGRPLIWQPYLQDDDLHLNKLDAWLSQTPYAERVCSIMRAWNQADSEAVTGLLPALMQGAAWRTWKCHTARWSSTLAAEEDLADRLVEFCTERT